MRKKECLKTVERVEKDINIGLSCEEVQRRVDAGLVNATQLKKKSK